MSTHERSAVIASPKDRSLRWFVAKLYLVIFLFLMGQVFLHDIGMYFRGKPSINNATVTKISHSRNDGVEKKVNRTAIVYVTKALDECKAIRLEHLLQTTSPDWDIWILHNHDRLESNGETSALQSSLEYVRRLERQHTNLFHASQMNETIPDFDSSISGAAKSSFVRWLVEHKEYQYAWNMEDDILFTGKWSQFFDQIQIQAAPAAADFVGPHIKRNDAWSRFSTPPCYMDKRYISYVDKDPKIAANTTTVSCGEVLQWSSLWSVVRISNRWAHQLLADLQSGVLHGHHEAIFQALQKGHADLKYAKLPPDLEGHNEAGSWGRYKDKTKSSLELYQPVEANRIYHPLKCEAYIGERLGEFKELMVSYGWNNGTSLTTRR
jgi:hypothetical protein